MLLHMYLFILDLSFSWQQCKEYGPLGFSTIEGQREPSFSEEHIVSILRLKDEAKQ
jgi:hypothetical protein